MRKILFISIIFISTMRLLAQTNAPVRLALISESDDASAASDILTAQLSNNQKLQLLERNEIEKVYREQGMSAENKDYLKLGQVLGADGLLIMDLVRTPQTTNLTARLIAVKPGVVLTDGSFPWPLKDTAQWADSISTYLNPFLPKLSLLVKDAIPISVVNLRSAISSTEGVEAERELKLLTIQRLSQERQFFVLERQRMQSLGEEKELKLDDSAFWNGSYLLEGVVDQNGYSKETITINARLTPPKGGTPLLMEVSGSRTNLAEVINRLAAKIIEELKVEPTVKEWNASDEAAQYFAEAQWALGWGMLTEAQMAADSAWALGKNDVDCASVRVSAYLDDVPDVVSPDISYFYSSRTGFHYVHINDIPDPKYCDVALYALKCYYEFSKTSPDGEPRILWRGKGWNDWRNSEWYLLGIDALVAASRVLQHFNYVPESQKPTEEKLSELRTLARLVADLISKSPSVHDSYFVGTRLATHDELSHTIEQHPNIFRCEVDWGCYWQERPEDSIALYRELMSSPVFCYIHGDFWHRNLIQPRLIAWNEEDQKRIPQVWADFVRELTDSTNVLLRMEAQALAMADAPNTAKAQQAQQEWWNIVRSNREDLVANNVELFYLGWGVVYDAETEAMDRDYWSKTVPAQKTKDAFEKQKEFLKANQPYDFMEFVQTFQEKNYSKSQALEIQPLLAAYKSNLVAQSQTASLMQIGQLRGAISQVSFLENDVSRILNPPAPAPSPSVPQPPQQTILTASKASVSAPTQSPEIVTNVLLVKKFLPIPLDGLPGDKIAAVTITAHHWLEGKLVLDFQYGAFVYSFDANGSWQSTRNVTFPAIAILDPVTEYWQVISRPEVNLVSQNRFYHHTTLYRGEVFTSDGGQIQKYDVAKKAWQVLDVSGVGNCELFTVSDHLYAATADLILEILDGGTRTHILASNRRQPPASALDTENLGTPALFAGPDQSLRAAAGNKIVTWDGEDWRTVCSAPQAPTPPLISDLGVLFLADGWDAPAGIWRLATDSDHVDFLLSQAERRGTGAVHPGSNEDPKPAWKLPLEFSLIRAAAASRGQDLYLMVNHAKSQNIVDELQHLIIGKKILPQDGYHAELLCFSGSDPAPQKIFLKFDGEDDSLPVTGDNRAAGFKVPNVPSSWLLFSTNYLFCGRETFDALSSGGGDSGSIPTQTGVWMIPLGQIDPELARLRKMQQEQQTLANAAQRQAAQTLLEKYDHNHDGIIDLGEREDALGDPAFIESELDLIDTNHYGWLAAEELAYFDANTNKILEPKEQAGIEIAQHLLAARLMKKFDVNGDGSLDRQEFNDLYQSSFGADSGPIHTYLATFPDDNRDGKIDLGELETFLKQQTRKALRPHGTPGEALNQMRLNLGQPIDSKQMFKTAVEFYWQNPGSFTNRPPFGSRPTSGAGFAPTGLQNGSRL